MLTSTLTLMLLEILMEEFLVDTLMLMPPESSSRFSTLLTEQDSALLTLVSPLLPPSTQSLLLLQLSTLSLLLLPPSTQSLLLPQCTLVLLLPLLRGRGVRLMLPSLEEPPGSSLPPPPLSTTHQCVPMLPILMLVWVTMDLDMLVLVTLGSVTTVLDMLGSICKPPIKSYLKDSGLSSLLCM